MWSRKELKKKARILIKSNYWRSVSVCFLIAMLTASYPISRSLFLNYFPNKIQTKTELILPAFISAESLSSAFLDFIPDNFVVASFLHTIQNSLKCHFVSHTWSHFFTFIQVFYQQSFDCR